MRLLMPFQIGLLHKRFAADMTTMFLLARMQELVLLEVGLLRKISAANLAAERFVSGVNTSMFDKVRLLGETLVAHVTGVRLYARMD